MKAADDGMKDDATTAPAATVGEQIAKMALSHGDLPALQDLRRAPLSFSELAKLLGDIRQQVAAAGISEGDRVAVWIQNRADAAVWLTALGDICECLPLVPSMTSDAVLQAFDVLKIKALITDGTDADACGAAVDAWATPRVTIGSNPDDWAWTVAGSAGAPCAPGTDARADAVAFYLMTSGSTGAPKIVPVRPEAITLTTSRAARDLEIAAGETTLNVMPLNHVHGLVSGLFLPWMGGACAIMPGEYRASAFLDWYQISKPTWFSVSPAIYDDILRRAQATGADLRHPGLRFVRCGSAALNDTLRGRVEAQFGVPMLEAYGMSEALQICGTPFSAPRAGTVGRSLADHLAILDAQGHAVPAGATGEICVKGRTVMSHYANGPNAEVFRDGWFKTGDIGHLDADGYLSVTGRMSGRINLGGEMVVPTQIENALMRIDGISACICFGMSGEDGVEILCAAVVLADGTTPDTTALRNAARAVLPLSKVPARFHVVDDIPRDANGKQDRARLARSLADVAAPAAPGASPPGSVDEWLANCFRRALRLDRVAPDTDFFEVGGTSLDATELVLEIETTLGEPVHLPILFEAPTIEQLSARLWREYPETRRRFKAQVPATGRAVSGGAPSGVKGPLPALSRKFGATSVANPVFVLSAPRCGSTLLRVMLAGHPDLFSPPEMRLLMHRSVDEWAQRNDGRFRFFRDGLVQALMSSRALDEAGARDWLDRAAAGKMPVEQVYDAIQRGVGARRIVDKSPVYALDPNVLKSMLDRFEVPKFVVLHRNPFDMKRSYVSARMDQLWMFDGPSDAGELAEKIWKDSYSNIETFKAQVDRRQIHHLHFERLVQDPADVMKRLSRFLDIPFDAKTVAPFGNDPNRMLAGLNPASKMIGDPGFKKRTHIDRARSGVGFTLPADSGLSGDCLSLAARQGYRSAAFSHLETHVMTHQRRLLRDWEKGLKPVGNMIFRPSVGGARPPLFWVMQSASEATRLSRALGPDQPLFAMRSGHLVVSRFDSGIVELAEAYVQSILDIHPSGQIVLGGNCQGADVALEMCHIFARRGRPVTKLIAVDPTFNDHPGVPTAAVFGAQSHCNPFRNDLDGGNDGGWLAPKDTTDFLPCGHGQYFSDAILPQLAERIAHHLNAAQFPKDA